MGTAEEWIPSSSSSSLLLCEIVTLKSVTIQKSLVSKRTSMLTECSLRKVYYVICHLSLGMVHEADPVYLQMKSHDQEKSRP